MRGEAEGRYERGTSFGCGVAAEKPCIGFIVTNPYLAEVYVRIRTTTCSSDAALIYESRSVINKGCSPTRHPETSRFAAARRNLSKFVPG